MLVHSAAVADYMGIYEEQEEPVLPAYNPQQSELIVKITVRSCYQRTLVSEFVLNTAINALKALA